MKIKKGDTIIVRTGKDKGKTGKVDAVLSPIDKVLVSGINIAKRHRRAKKTGEKGQIIDVPMPIHVSNVSLLEDGKPVRVGYKLADGKKLRISRKSGKAI
ncbi:MAG: 50S ribosomal protein L24 [bacterium]|nr:50S ribosomal protein L24 [bacterium]